MRRAEAVAVRRFEGLVIIQGKMGQAKIDHGPSTEPFIVTAPMMKKH